MESIAERLTLHYWPFTNMPIPLGGLNIVTVLSTILSMVVLWTLLRLAVRRFAWIPGRAQLAVELVLGAFDGLITSLLQFEKREDNRHYLPLIASLFLYVFTCNAIVIIPLPHLEEPTSDLNCTLSLGLMSLTYATYCGFKAHGTRGFLTEMCGPMWHTEGGGVAALAGKLSALGFFPLHVAGECSKAMSISFRLFGNITGAAIISTVVGALSYFFIAPLAMNAFFLGFEAAVQAFVFAMLTLIYITVNMR